MKNIIILFLSILLITSIIHADEDWILLNPNQNPGNSSGHAMAYIGDDKVLFTDGSGWAQFNETWIYDFSNNSWTQMNPNQNPDSRWLHKLSYVGDDKTLLFGGDRHGLVDLNDTWIYALSDNTWTLMNPQTSPETRYAYGLAYIGDDKALLFGGQVGSQVWNDLWIYDYSENNWTKKYPNDNPSGRYGPAMCYLGNSKVILFGGSEQYGEQTNDTWIYDLNNNTWTLKNPPNNPPGRNSHDLVYIGNGKALLFGGEDEDINYFNDTWIYDLSNNTWTADLNNTNPPARSYHQLSVNNINNPTRAILFGGDWNFGDTWLFGGGDYKLNISDFNNTTPCALTLLSAYPNPFNPSTTISYGLDKDSKVVIQIYSLTGKLITTLINTEQKQGWYSVLWNGTDHNINQVPAGIYLSKITSNNTSKTIKLMLLK